MKDRRHLIPIGVAFKPENEDSRTVGLIVARTARDGIPAAARAVRAIYGIDNILRDCVVFVAVPFQLASIFVVGDLAEVAICLFTASVAAWFVVICYVLKRHGVVAGRITP